MKKEDEILNAEIEKEEKTISFLTGEKCNHFKIPKNYFKNIEKDFLCNLTNDDLSREKSSKKEFDINKKRIRIHHLFIVTAIAVAFIIIGIIPIYKNISKQIIITPKKTTNNYESYVLNEVDDATIEDYISEYYR